MTVRESQRSLSPPALHRLRLGLCCQFAREPIKFRTTTATAMLRLPLENDDKIFTPSDVLSVCTDRGVPLVYDVHHHRCLPDGLSVESATERAVATWNREPLFHISSPLAGWRGPRPERHHDYVNPRDFPPAWKRLVATVEVEAKAKELAVLKLLAWLKSNRR